MSDLSELEDSPKPSSNSQRKHTATLRELKKKVIHGKVEITGLPEGITPSMLFKSSPLAQNPDALPFDQRINSVHEVLMANGLTITQFIRSTCALEAMSQRLARDPKYQPSMELMMDVSNVRAWAKETATKMLLNEAKNMQSNGALFTESKMTPAWLKSWSLDKVYADLEMHMPYLVSLLREFLEDGRRPGIRTETHNTTIATVGSIIWNARSQRANYFAKGFTTYLYTSGAHAATIGVLNRLGISTSYNTLLDSLESLSNSCTEVFQKVAYQCRSFWMWDNINFDSNVAEQRVKNAGSFESGTAATLVEFEPPDGKGVEAIDEALELEKYLEAVQNAPDIKLEDLILTTNDEEHFRKEFTFEAIKILAEHAGSNFKRFKKLNLQSRPFMGTLLHPRITRFYPLPTFHLEQASANGNATVIEAIIRAIKAVLSPWFKSRLTVITGDLLTVNRILSVRDVRTLYMRTKVHVKDAYESLIYLVPFAGLFHTRMTAATSVLQTHFGKPNARPIDGPASLWRHNELLKRKNIIPNGKMVYRVSQDLIMHSLYARILDIIRLESTHESLRVFGKHLKRLPEAEAWAELQTVVNQAIIRFTTPEEADADDVLRNSILFIRDALLFRSFISSIKSGNVPTIILVLKVWTIIFRGSSRKQYAQELLRFRHNILYAWPEPLRDLILANILVNTSGNPDGWKETDLLQEHMNYWIKVVYKARGANASWAWLETISTCITTLRELAKSINGSLAPPNPTKHTTPNLEHDIGALLKSLVEDKVHTRDCSRHFSDEALRATDAYVTGLQQLVGSNSALIKFNESRFGKRITNSNPLYAPLGQPNDIINATNVEAASTTGNSELGGSMPEPNSDSAGEELFQMVIGDDDDEPFEVFNE